MEKPEIILELEKLLNTELFKVDTTDEIHKGQRITIARYATDEKNNVIGISFHYFDFSDIFENVISIISTNNKLTDLNLSFIKRKDLSALVNLSQIKHLQLYNLPLEDISFFKCSIFTNLTDLRLAKNQIFDISPLQEFKNQLDNLILDSNKITTLPEWICDFKAEIMWDDDWRNNAVITLKNNPIENIPIEIIKQGKNEIRSWFEQQQKYGKETVYEAKILIVGEPGAGKTTLMKKMIDSNVPIPDNEITSTLGVSVSQNFKISHPQLPDIEITANIWDFGGQEIQFMLHQYFLTKDALYVVVSDKRIENTRFDYWFQMIEMLGGDSSRILVLMNRFKNSLGIRTFARLQYQNDFIDLKIDDDELDLSETNEKWVEFTKKIATNLINLPVVGQNNIRVWNRIRKKIEQIAEPYISISELYKMSRSEGMELDSEIEQMLNYFHKIGVVIYFAEDYQLANTIYLKPNWITQAIYAALSDKNIDYYNGCFSKQWLFNFWQQLGYNSHECGYLLNLMQKDKFDICYQIPSDPDKYMVPSILNTDRPKKEDSFEDLIELRYSYKGFMPYGIMSRLIVRLHKYIYNQTVWQRGAILDYENNTKAEIVYPFGKSEIQIRITGKQKKEFRAIIKSELDTIVQQFPYTPEILIPCICDTCRNSQEPHFYEYNELIERRAAEKKTIECRKKPYREVDVIELINGIEFTNFKRLLVEENFEEFFNLMKSKFAGVSYQTLKSKMEEGNFQREFYHILKENGLVTETEHATSDGRIDNLIKIGNSIYIFEHKIDSDAQSALNQIIAKEYQQKFEYDSDKIYLIGVNFSTKTRNITDFKFKKL